MNNDLFIDIVNGISRNIMYRGPIPSEGPFGTQLTWIGRYLAYDDNVDIIQAASFVDTEGALELLRDRFKLSHKN